MPLGEHFSTMRSIACKRSSHSIYDIECYIVFYTRYKYKVLYDNFAEVMCRSNQRGVCFTDYVSVIIGNISPDHVHILISVPPHLPVSNTVQYMRGEKSQKTARRIQGIPIPSIKEC